jgi:peptidoglycan/xylan/chitin deacetylase (PgdA/CDA1 family)
MDKKVQSAQLSRNSVELNPVPILNYHSISSGGTNCFAKFTLHPKTFAQHMKYILDQGYTPITVNDYAQLVRSSSPLPDKPVILTFDDGFGDFYNSAFPILQEFRFPATIYVVTDYIEGTSNWLKPVGEENRRMLTWSQLFEVQRAGIECGTHSATHIHLDTAKPEIAYQEISHSKDTLEQKLGSSVHSMAYPYGHYTRAVCQMVIETGYHAACAVRNAMSHTNDNLFSLARITINRDTDVACLHAILAGKSFSLAPQQEYLWVTGWRQIRRVLQMFSQTSQ